MVGIRNLVGIFRVSNLVVTYQIALSHYSVGRFYVPKTEKYLRDDLF